MYDAPDPWNYKRAPFRGKMCVSLEPPFSNDTCTTVKYEYAVLEPIVQQARIIIIQHPDLSAKDLEYFPELYKRCGDDRIQKLINDVSDERRFSVWRFCIEVLSEVSGYPFDTIKKYLHAKSQQKKSRVRGRPTR